MTQCCSIPLIRCDYESALKAANTHQKESEAPKVGDTPSSVPMLREQAEENKPVCTSGRSRTVIDYKQFLEEYADAPPSPPKRRREVDLKLKCRPAKTTYCSRKIQIKSLLPNQLLCQDLCATKDHVAKQILHQNLHQHRVQSKLDLLNSL